MLRTPCRHYSNCSSGLQMLAIGCLMVLPPYGRVALAQSNSAGPSAVLIGCLDEQPGPQYLLRDTKEMRLIAALEPVGFKAEVFAKYLGQTVSLNGSREPKDGSQLFKVRSIKMLSKTCASPGTPAVDSAKLSKIATTSGCLDEEPGPRYVLRGVLELKLLMALEPDGFPNENFARYLGHRVEVRGRTYAKDEKTVMKVQSVKSLADQCAPH